MQMKILVLLWLVAVTTASAKKNSIEDQHLQTGKPVLGQVSAVGKSSVLRIVHGTPVVQENNPWGLIGNYSPRYSHPVHGNYRKCMFRGPRDRRRHNRRLRRIRRRIRRQRRFIRRLKRRLQTARRPRQRRRVTRRLRRRRRVLGRLRNKMHMLREGCGRRGHDRGLDLPVDPSIPAPAHQIDGS